MTTVTLIIPTYNAGDHLLPSVSSALEQTWRATEVIVVDDGSTDGSVETLGRLDDARLRILHQANAGKSIAMNRAIAESAGEFVAIQDADDLSDPERVERQLQAMQQEPDLGAVFCCHDLLVGDKRVAPRFRERDRDACRRDIDNLRMPAHDPTIMFRRACIEPNPFDVSLRIGQGYDFILRLGEKYPMRVISKCLYSYRVHAGSATRLNIEERIAAVENVQQRAIERRGLLHPPPGMKVKRSRNSTRDNNLPAHFLESVTDLVRRGQRRAAIWAALGCWSMHPWDFVYWRPAIAACLPYRVLRRIRHSYP